MRNIFITVALLYFFSNTLFAGNNPFPEESIDCKVSRHYKYREDKLAGREVFVTYNGIRPLKNACIEIVAGNKKEQTRLVPVHVILSRFYCRLILACRKTIQYR